MKRHLSPSLASAWLPALALLTAEPVRAATNYTLLGWSEAGMTFVDTDYSVFAIHPLGNTIHAQIVQTLDGAQARLLTNAAAAGITVTYEAVADPDGSVNRTSASKINFWEYAPLLLGTNLAPDTGLGASMPGPLNTPQPMPFNTNSHRFTAAGVPVTPYDDSGRFNPYPLMRFRAWKGGVSVTNTDVVLPVTDEMQCRLCHASGTVTAAMPVAGWASEINPERDYRLNILRLHDEHQATNPAYAAALAANGYHSNGLTATVLVGGKPILCAKCHASHRLPGSGTGSIRPLTQAIHGNHATVVDPRDGQPLDSETNRTSCYTCHGGTATHFLRGAMGTADSVSGQLTIQCQSCHGTMVQVAATNRVAGLSEPNCQACHVGDALNTIGGQFRFANALTNGALRTPANDRFATDPNSPSAGFSLFSHSRGHGNLACSACHGSPHGEFPSAVPNENLRNLQLQGSPGVLAECQLCHGTQTLTPGGGPHGMHRHDYDWADGGSGLHPNAESDAACGPCHGTQGGTSSRGTVLSQARGDRFFASLPMGDIRMWRGQTVGCTHCHSGTAPPTVGATSTNTQAAVPVTFTLTSSTNTVRIVSQPAHGLVGLSNKVATYTPNPDFFGTDTFVFASSKPQKESTNTALGTVVVAQVFTVGDGLPDWWRKLYFGGDGKSTNALSCATCDPDGDALDNRAEYQAGTDPLDPQSALRVFSLQSVSNGTRVGVASSAGRRYAMEVKSDLSTPDGWQGVASNVWGRTLSAQLTDPGAPATNARLYRVRVQP